MRIELVDARRIWDGAPHCAFTSLLLYRGRLLCALREAADHQSADGSIRIIESPTGDSFVPIARVGQDGADLRDPKLVAMPDGRLALLSGALRRLPDGKRLTSTICFSTDGRAWSPPRAVVGPETWLWNLAATKAGSYLGVGYHVLSPVHARLYTSTDLERLDLVVAELATDGAPSEGSIVVRSSGEALCLLRRDPGDGWLGRSHPPYREWRFLPVGARIGGPNLVEARGELVAAVRLHAPLRTAVCTFDEQSGRIEERVRLPSGGDTSYAGQVVRSDELLVSYYSSHEGATAVYLARLRLEDDAR